MRYKFEKWEDESTNPSRVINVKTNMTVTAYYKEVTEVRKGQPSESSVVTVTVHPKPAEATTLTLKLDKTDYNSGDPMVLSGNLTFTSDGAPLEGRTVDVYEDTVKIGSATTGTDGSYTFNHTAPEVTADTNYSYQAKFAGD